MGPYPNLAKTTTRRELKAEHTGSSPIIIPVIQALAGSLDTSVSTDNMYALSGSVSGEAILDVEGLLRSAAQPLVSDLDLSDPHGHAVEQLVTATRSTVAYSNLLDSTDLSTTRRYAVLSDRQFFSQVWGAWVFVSTNSTSETATFAFDLDYVDGFANIGEAIGPSSAEPYAGLTANDLGGTMNPGTAKRRAQATLKCSSKARQGLAFLPIIGQVPGGSRAKVDERANARGAFSFGVLKQNAVNTSGTLTFSDRLLAGITPTFSTGTASVLWVRTGDTNLLGNTLNYLLKGGGRDAFYAAFNMRAEAVEDVKQLISAPGTNGGGDSAMTLLQRIFK